MLLISGRHVEKIWIQKPLKSDHEAKDKTKDTARSSQSEEALFHTGGIHDEMLQNSVCSAPQDEPEQRRKGDGTRMEIKRQLQDLFEGDVSG